MSIYTLVETEHFDTIKRKIEVVIRNSTLTVGLKINGAVPNTDLIYESEVMDDGIAITSVHTKQEHIQKLEE